MLEAAAEVFAEHGFHDATVREICEKANANVAAVNYYFGDKQALYAAVFEYARTLAGDGPEELPGASPEQQLRAFIHSYLTRFFDEGRPAWLGRLIAQEMIQPTQVLDALVRERIRPNHERLKQIARELMDREVTEERLRLVAFSIAAQYLFYFTHRPIIARLYPDLKLDATAIELLTDHITSFSIAALKEYRP